MDPGTVLARRFEIERRVSAGGMSAVYRATDTHSGAYVAIKVLYGRDAHEHGARLYREARILEKLSHPGIVRYVAHGETEVGHPYLAMEWIPGETLGKRLARTGLTMSESVRLVRRIAEILKVPHARSVIHRDIKPGNLILRDADLDQPTVIDFGIARLGREASAITNTGVILGTLGYMAPEQARGGKVLDPRADVFSLGAVLFKCITGVPAFAGDDEIAILAKMLFETPPRLRDVVKDAPKSLDELLARMLSRDPLQRPNDAGVVAAELAALGDLEGTSTAQTRAASSHGDVITRGEQRLASIIAAATHEQDAEESTIADGTWQGLGVLTSSLRAAAIPFGGRLESMGDGMVVVTLPGRHSATDQATRAARCVLAMREVAPHVPMVLVTGRAVLAERVPIGDALDRALRMLAARRVDDDASADQGRKLPIHLDEVTAGLLDERFHVRSEGGSLVLSAEQGTSGDQGRKLLGRPTPCVGRERELAMLESVVAESVADDVARAVLVTAPAGVGKSRLRYELLRALRHREGAHAVWSSRGDPMRAGSPFGMLAQILRAGVGAQEGEPQAVQREKVRARVAEVVRAEDRPRVARFLSELLGVAMPEDDDVQLRAARHDPLLMGDQMRRAVEEWLGAECARQPVLLVLEDLHWGDLPTVKFVDSALRALTDHPLVVLALARPEVHDAFPDLFVERGVQEIRLKELSRKASERLVRQVLGETTDPDLVAQIVHTAGGNAFYLEELIRSAASAGGRAASKLALPETVLAMVQARLEALEPEARRVLRAASVFGQTFWRGGVLALLADEEGTAHVTAWLDELCERELVTRREATKFRGETEYVFRHALLAEAAYAMLTAKDRGVGHKLAAAWLEAAGESDAVVLAEHLERGGDPKRAITFWRKAAAQALEGNDLGACLARADRGIECGAEGEVLGRLLLRKAEAHRWRGENKSAKEAALAALRLLRRGGSRWFLAAGETVEASARLGDERDLHQAVDQLCDVSATGELSPPHVVALTRAACVLMQAGNYPSADDLVRTIDMTYAVRGEKEPDPLAAAHVHRARASRALVAGNTAAALAMFNTAIAHFERAGDTRAACRHLVSSAAACIELGAYDDAQAGLRVAEDTASRLGLSGVIADIRHHQAMAAFRAGDPRAAREKSDLAIRAFVEQGDRRMEASARLYRAIVRLEGGDREGARADLALALDPAVSPSPLRAHALAVSARLTLFAGACPAAAALASEAVALLDGLGGVEEGESFIRLTLAEVLDASGEHARAKEAIHAARVRIFERAALMSDAAWKERFVSRVAENARTLELARQWNVV